MTQSAPKKMPIIVEDKQENRPAAKTARNDI